METDNGGVIIIGDANREMIQREISSAQEKVKFILHVIVAQYGGQYGDFELSSDFSRLTRKINT